MKNRTYIVNSDGSTTSKIINQNKVIIQRASDDEDDIIFEETNDLDVIYDQIQKNDTVQVFPGTYYTGKKIDPFFNWKFEGQVEIKRKSSEENIGSGSVQYIDFGYFLLQEPGLFQVSQLGFQPDKIEFLAEAGVETENVNRSGDLNTNRTTNYQGSMHGYAKLMKSGEIKQFVQHSGGSGSSINAVSIYSNFNKCIGIRYADSNGNQRGILSASLDSFDNNGFMLNVDKANLYSLSGQIVTYKAYKTS